MCCSLLQSVAVCCSAVPVGVYCSAVPVGALLVSLRHWVSISKTSVLVGLFYE